MSSAMLQEVSMQHAAPLPLQKFQAKWFTKPPSHVTTIQEITRPGSLSFNVFLFKPIKAWDSMGTSMDVFCSTSRNPSDPAQKRSSGPPLSPFAQLNRLVQPAARLVASAASGRGGQIIIRFVLPMTHILSLRLALLTLSCM